MEYICYCFKYTEKDIIDDLKENGESTILKKIVMEKRRGGCNCSLNHPQKR